MYSLAISPCAGNVGQHTRHFCHYNILRAKSSTRGGSHTTLLFMRGNCFVVTCAPLLSVVTRTQGSRDTPCPCVVDVCPCCFRLKRVYYGSWTSLLSRYQRITSPMESGKKNGLEQTLFYPQESFSAVTHKPLLLTSILLQYTERLLWKLSNEKQSRLVSILGNNVLHCEQATHHDSPRNDSKDNYNKDTNRQHDTEKVNRSFTSDWSIDEHMFSNSRISKKRVLILMSDTGGGHRASAEALRTAFDDLYPGQLDTVIVDLWTQIVKGPFRNLPKQYMFLQKNPTLWKLTWL